MHYKSWEKRGNGETAAGITEAHKVRGFFKPFFFTIGQFLFRWWRWYGGFRGTWSEIEAAGEGEGVVYRAGMLLDITKLVLNNSIWQYVIVNTKRMSRGSVYTIHVNKRKVKVCSVHIKNEATVCCGLGKLNSVKRIPPSRTVCVLLWISRYESFSLGRGIIMKPGLVGLFIWIKIFSFYKRREAVCGIRFVRRYGSTENFFFFFA